MSRHHLALLLAFAGSFAQAAGLVLSSPSVKPGGRLGLEQVLDSQGCTGKNLSPALKWTGVPKGTKSFAITFYDIDAPTGSGWWHWVVFNIPAKQHELAEGAGDANGHKLPPGAVQGRTDFGAPGFGGACPPSGDKPHRYVFTLHALKISVMDLSPDASAAQVGYMIHLNELGRARLEARYGRR